MRRDWRVATSPPFPCACRLFTPSRIRSNSVSASSTRRGLVLRLTTTSPPRTGDTSTTSLYTANRLRTYSRSATSERAERNRHRRVYTRNRPQQIEVMEFESLAAANGFGEETAPLSAVWLPCACPAGAREDSFSVSLLPSRAAAAVARLVVILIFGVVSSSSSSNCT